jgi:hypothetical protein
MPQPRPASRPVDSLDPWDYDGEALCPRCGSGYPACASLPAGTPMWALRAAHEAACERYHWAESVCFACEKEASDLNRSERASVVDGEGVLGSVRSGQLDGDGEP